MAELIRVLVADDHFVVRQGLAALLAPRNGMEVVGEAANGRKAVELAHALQPDVILMDLIMPEMDGTAAIARIKAQNPAARILVLTSFGEREKVAAALQAGAMGYLLKDSSPDDLFDAIRSVHHGRLFLPQELATELLQSPATPPASSHFTVRELDVLRLLVQGMSNPAIGQALFISPTTVRSHVTSILTKLHVANRTQAAVVAQELHLV
jgi:NarL family two-component system response regulator LiaR